MGGQMPLEILVLPRARILAPHDDAAVDAILAVEDGRRVVRLLMQLLVPVLAPLGGGVHLPRIGQRTRPWIMWRPLPDLPVRE